MASPQIENGYTRLANELLEALCKAHLSSTEWQVVMTVIRETYGRNGKKQATISNGMIANLTGIHRRNVIRVIKQLEAKKVVSVVTLARGKSVGIQKDFEKWEIVSRLTLPSVTADTSKTEKRSVQASLRERQEKGLASPSVSGDTTPSVGGNTKNSVTADTPSKIKDIDLKKTPPLDPPPSTSRAPRPRKPKPPSSLAEVEAYARQRDSPVCSRTFYEFFEAADWYDSQGKPVLNWKQKLITWESHQKQRRGNGKMSAADWVEYTRELERRGE